MIGIWVYYESTAKEMRGGVKNDARGSGLSKWIVALPLIEEDFK